MHALNGTSSTWAVSNSTNATNAAILDDGWVRGDRVLPPRRRQARFTEQQAKDDCFCFMCFCVNGCRGGLLLGECRNLQLGYYGCSCIGVYFTALAVIPAVILAAIAGLLCFNLGLSTTKR
ncbi:unnamed protein product, partial [Mesorhabditis spiculigera]